ncbi:hypothetical protein HELRODRAFT_158580 [Helobdella robusta]|uniref:Uncharacterized protein n=1 Tax=Helobdella robusta TaxID=6412 RepID=T1EMZ0_HELRO|nr:hypothetical protein HELRODRAFT_158580 [Helobdella robusta]ESO12135.1 hypothetical protein HELRODRAFT_158580 [Helobdella robusta]
MNVANEIFSYTISLSKTLQKVDCDLAECCTAVNASTARWEVLQNHTQQKSSSLNLKSLSTTRWSARDDAVRALKYGWNQKDLRIMKKKEKVLSLVDDLRKRPLRKRKRHYDESVDNETEFTTREHFRVNIFLVIVDNLNSEINKRRNAYVEINENFKAVVQFKTLSMGELEIAADGLRSLFPNDLDDTLNTELLHLKSHLATLDQNAVPHTPTDLCKWIRLNDLQCVYPNVVIALRMYTCTPATNCSAEPSFSCLKRVKTICFLQCPKKG